MVEFSGEGETNSNPSVWIEKTKVEGREYKQEGDLALGSAIIAPSRDEGGRKRYETLREADVGDIVLHLVQEQYAIVGVSVIESELHEDFEGPPDDRWSDEQQREGGYLRWLTRFEGIEPHIHVYDDVLDNDDYEDALRRIRRESEKIFYSKRLSLNQGHYFTRCPDELVAILIDESSHLEDLLQERGYDTADIDLTRGPQIEPVDEYDGIVEATDDVTQRLEAASTSVEQFYAKFSKSIVSAWTDLLSKIAVQTDSEITADEAVLIDQIRTVYQDNESWLTEQADTLGIGSLFALDPPAVLYTVLLREMQSEIPEISQVNANHVKLKTILNEEYTVTTTTENDPQPDQALENNPEPDHALFDILDANAGDRAVHLFTGPPDYWVTALRNRAISFPDGERSKWERVSPGDIGLLHSRAEPGVLDIDPQPNGFIGAVIFGDRFEKDEPWWLDEFENGETFPYLISFDRLFVTGAFGDIDQAASVDTQPEAAITSDIEAVTENLLDFTAIEDRVREETGRGLSAQGSFSTFRTDGVLEYERPRIVLEALAPKLSEVSPVNPQRDIYPSLSTDLLDGLYFPDDQDERIIQEIEAALRGGKHIILTGPPGTGKTEIAEQVVRALAAAYPSHYTGSRVTTATADWSTFDTVGGYMPTEARDSEDGDGSELSFTPGAILNRLRTRDPDVLVNEPLVIDELNRADIDKAFGQLFTVLSGQSVTLPYTRNGEEIEILPADALQGVPEPHEYVLPSSWRMFATMNTYDKTSLYEMSYAFMRRFAFIRVGVPSLSTLTDEDLTALVREYVAAWEQGEVSLDLDEVELQSVGAVWQQTNAAVEERAIGPAIIRDLVLYLDNHSERQLEPRLTQAVIAYIFPQLEGVPKRKQIIKNIANVAEIDDSELRSVAREMLQVSFDDV
jgi:5-methylcytosine-specific restriction protein B